MATLSSRFSGIGESVFGDQEKDSNALLLELDKGCKLNFICTIYYFETRIMFFL